MRVSGVRESCLAMVLVLVNLTGLPQSSSVVSLLMTSLIVALLVFHYLVKFRRGKGPSTEENQVQARIAGRHFMIQTTLFVCTVGVLALFMSKLVRRDQLSLPF